MEDDKLIAAFMGRTIQTDGISWFDGYFKPLKYDDWNTLMPVIDKIESLGYIVFITQNICTIKYADIRATKQLPIISITGQYMEEDTKFSNTYKAVVEFIKWYNEIEDEK